jgi:hypothetical protein
MNFWDSLCLGLKPFGNREIIGLDSFIFGHTETMFQSACDVDFCWIHVRSYHSYYMRRTFHVIGRL